MIIEISKAEKAKVFAMHIGCDLVVTEQVHDMHPFDIGEKGLRLDGVVMNEIYVHRIAECKIDIFNQCKLSLTPLSDISDLDAFEVARICLARHNRHFEKPDEEIIYKMGERKNVDVYVKGRLEFEVLIDATCVSFRAHPKSAWTFCNGDCYYMYDAFEVHQYLTKAGYDLPLFFSPNHPGNGKTAIELGLAVPKKIS